MNAEGRNSKANGTTGTRTTTKLRRCHPLVFFAMGFTVCRFLPASPISPLKSLSTAVIPPSSSAKTTAKDEGAGEYDEVDRGAGTAAAFNYVPAPVERYVVENADFLGYGANPASGCKLWKNTSLPFYHQLQQYLEDLEQYNKLVDSYTQVYEDVRLPMRNRKSNEENITQICNRLEIATDPQHQQQRGDDSLKTVFAKSGGQLSLMEHGGGYMEPILPPMRHPKWCYPPSNSRNNRKYLMKTSYMVHDFRSMCRSSIHPASRTVFVDLGASLDFDFHKDDTPVIDLIRLYGKFGIKFDHIYAYEIKFTEPSEVFKLVPSELLGAYHWINVPVEVGLESKQNPWNLLLEHFHPDDFVVVKLDVDKTKIELELIQQLLDNPALLQLVDQFYFEHHVSLTEWWPYAESAKKSLLLFDRLRRSGINAHYWV